MKPKQATTHVVMFSGGIGSWATATRVQLNLDDKLILLCADTNTEADDWRPFVDAASASIDRSELVMIDNDGRDIWDVFDAGKFIGNSRVDLCSRILKREPLRKWLEENCDPESTIVYLGFDWTEEHRLERSRPHWVPWTIAAPLCDPPYMQKAELIDEAKAAGIPIPKLYEAGFAHNNCGGACVKAGQAQWKKLLGYHPERYAYHEMRENQFRETSGKNVAILRSRKKVDGQPATTPLTLTTFREQLEADPELYEHGDWGACSCMGETEIGIEEVAVTFPDSEVVMPKHPARFRPDHLDWVLEHVPPGRVLDPFAGVGTIHELIEHGYMTVGIEIEPAWAQASPHTTVGDATDLGDDMDPFDAIVTSPVFGNRMSDHHVASDSSKRNTYTHVLGDQLLPNNAGKMHFREDSYKRLHVLAWKECYRVLKPGGSMVVNVKNFIRKGEEVDVVGWHKKILERVFGTPFIEDRIVAPGMRQGRNHEARVEWEAMLLGVK